MAVLGGRIDPVTSNGVPGVTDGARHQQGSLERFALGAVLALLAARSGQGAHGAAVAVLLALEPRHAARLYLWQPGARCARRWCGCCTRPMPSSYCLALRACAETGLILLRWYACAHRRRRDRRHDDRHDDAHRTRPHRAAAAGSTTSTSPATCACSPQWCAWACRWCTPQFPSARRWSPAVWACGFMLYAIRYAPFLLRPDGSAVKLLRAWGCFSRRRRRAARSGPAPSFAIPGYSVLLRRGRGRRSSTDIGLRTDRRPRPRRTRWNIGGTTEPTWTTSRSSSSRRAR